MGKEKDSPQKAAREEKVKEKRKQALPMEQDPPAKPLCDKNKGEAPVSDNNNKPDHEPETEPESEPEPEKSIKESPPKKRKTNKKLLVADSDNESEDESGGEGDEIDAEETEEKTKNFVQKLKKLTPEEATKILIENNAMNLGKLEEVTDSMTKKIERKKNSKQRDGRIKEKIKLQKDFHIFNNFYRQTRKAGSNEKISKLNRQTELVIDLSSIEFDTNTDPKLILETIASCEKSLDLSAIVHWRNFIENGRLYEKLFKYFQANKNLLGFRSWTKWMEDLYNKGSIKYSPRKVDDLRALARFVSTFPRFGLISVKSPWLFIKFLPEIKDRLEADKNEADFWMNLSIDPASPNKVEFTVSEFKRVQVKGLDPKDENVKEMKRKTFKAIDKVVAKNEDLKKKWSEAQKEEQDKKSANIGEYEAADQLYY